MTETPVAAAKEKQTSTGIYDKNLYDNHTIKLRIIYFWNAIQ